MDPSRKMHLLSVTLLIVVLVRSGSATNSTEVPEPDEEFEGRLQSYASYWYNDVAYWWPWFSDLATVIMIKLKIAIGLAAMYAFGDGYYWRNSPETNYDEVPAVWNNYQYAYYEPVRKPWYKFWGRRKRDLTAEDDDATGEQTTEEPGYLDFLFDVFDIDNEDCRKRVVCEMDFDIQSDTRLESNLKAYKFDLFEKYRGEPAEQKSDCRKMYPKCWLRPHQQIIAKLFDRKGTGIV